MNYEKTILEMLERIKTLEEQMKTLLNASAKVASQQQKISTNDIKQYVEQLKASAKNLGEKSLVLKSGDIHKKLNLKNAMPQVCNAMRQAMHVGDTILHTTPSGNSSTIEIKYII